MPTASLRPRSEHPLFVKAGVQILSFNKNKKRSCKFLLNGRGFLTADVATNEVHCIVKDDISLPIQQK